MSAPVQIAAEWWMAMAPNGLPYFHNTATQETTWIAPMLSTEASTAATSTNQEASLRESERAAPQTVAAQEAGLTSGWGQTSQQSDDAMSKMMQAAPPTAAHDITATGSGHIPAPWVRFDDVKIDRALLEPMLKAGFATPTSIQSYAWPIGCEGRDMIGVAKTGSGKTLGFLLPAFARIVRERMSEGPVMLVLAPTRELAVQIDQDAKKFLGHAGATTALAYGGAPKRDQLYELRKRPQLLTATPGRLNDFLEARDISLDRVSFVCLDEADRMLDMGFEPQIRKILQCVPRQRQTFMFTATWPKEVRNLAWEFMNEPVEIRVGDADALQANKDIDQRVEICRDIREKEDRLVRLVRDCPDQVIVFTATKRLCESLQNQIYRSGASVDSIHGDRDQASRDRALASFKSGSSKVLVATDVAGRGLDVKTIRLVINFDPANNAEDYVHRIGRTARAGMTGTAVTFLLPNEAKKACDIVDVMTKTGKPIPRDLEDLAARGRHEKDFGRPRYSKGKGKGGGKDGGGGGGGGGGDSRPGDWNCSKCGASVFASKDSCFKCGERKPSGGGGGYGGDRGGGYGGGERRARSRSRSRSRSRGRDYGGDRGSDRGGRGDYGSDRGGYGGGYGGGGGGSFGGC